ncbi:MAG TPA: putative maltokinase [Mucilaginibacter sp.]|nr:putative maltokinase [Mucilaginibacter sp.]
MGNIDITARPELLKLSKPWTEFARDKKALDWLAKNVLYDYMRKCRWFAGKARMIKFLKIQQLLAMPLDGGVAYLIIVHVGYTYGDEEKYAMPVSFLPDDYELMGQVNPKAFIAKMSDGKVSGWLVDAIYDLRFQTELFKSIWENAVVKQETGHLAYHKGKGLDATDEDMGFLCVVPDLEQSNSSLVFGNKYFFKFYRKLFREINPEVEMLQFLTETGGFKNIPAFCGSLIWERPGIPPVTLGLMMQKVSSKSDSWVATGDDLNDFLFMFVDKLFSIRDDVFEKVELLGRRTAEMHLALLTEQSDDAFKPEGYDSGYVEWIQGHLNKLLDKRINLLKENYSRLDKNARSLADDFINSEEVIRRFFEKIGSNDLKSLRIRIHGDYHLGQVLFTGTDYLIIDFEGEPESTITDRKIKHSPLKDVAGMIRSFHYAVCAKLYFSNETKGVDPLRLQKAADRWYKLITDAYIDAYMHTIGDIATVFGSRTELNFLLQMHLLEKAVYELGYELNGRPDWIRIPLKGIQHVLFEIEKFNG